MNFYLALLVFLVYVSVAMALAYLSGYSYFDVFTVGGISILLISMLEDKFS